MRLHWAIDPAAVQAFQDRHPGIFPEDVPVAVRQQRRSPAGDGHLQQLALAAVGQGNARPARHRRELRRAPRDVA